MSSPPRILDSNDQNSRSLFLSTGLFRLAPVHGELLSEHEDPQPCNPIELREDGRIERLYDRHHEQNLHAGRMESRNPKIQRNQLGRSFRGARASKSRRLLKSVDTFGRHAAESVHDCHRGYRAEALRFRTGDHV